MIGFHTNLCPISMMVRRRSFICELHSTIECFSPLVLTSVSFGHLTLFYLGADDSCQVKTVRSKHVRRLTTIYWRLRKASFSRLATTSFARADRFLPRHAAAADSRGSGTSKRNQGGSDQGDYGRGSHVQPTTHRFIL